MFGDDFGDVFLLHATISDVVLPMPAFKRR